MTHPIDLIECYSYTLGSALKHLFRLGALTGVAYELELGNAHVMLERVLRGAPKQDSPNVYKLVPLFPRCKRKASDAAFQLVIATDVHPALRALFREMSDGKGYGIHYDGVYEALKIINEELDK